LHNSGQKGASCGGKLFFKSDGERKLQDAGLLIGIRKNRVWSVLTGANRMGAGSVAYERLGRSA